MSLDGLLVTCPSCSQKNRIGLERLDEAPTCGRCQAKLGSITEPLTVADDSFDELVTRSALPVLVDFWAPWCGPCRTFAPVFLEFARKNAGRVLACKVNVDDAPRTAARFQIQSIPTIALFHGGRLVSREVGSVSASVLARMLSTAEPGRTARS